VSDPTGRDEGRDPEPTEFFPPPVDEERADPTGTDLPPIGADREPEPTRVLPPTEPDAGPTEAMPPVGGPYDPGPPYGGAGGPGGGGDDGDYEPEPEPWWRQPGPLAALIAGVVALVVLVIALIVWAGDDGDESDGTLPVLPTSSTLAPATTAATTSVSESSTTVTTTTSTTLAPTTTSTTTTTPPTTTTTTSPPTTTTTTLPPTTTTTTTIPVVTVPPQPAATTWTIIENSPDLSEMRDAVETAGLVDLLDGDQLVTVLAPSNAAFEALRATESGADLLDDPDRLAALLRRHVVVESISAGEFPGRGQLDTAADSDDCEALGAAEGCDVLTTGGDDESPPTVEGASFLVTDVEAANGLLDVIDRVLVP
jgi:uncharacterized surface protein with fasciclin (FAS1) repeats